MYLVDQEGNPIDSNNRLPTSAQITGSDVQVPTDIQSILREVNDYTTAVLAGNASFTGATIDGTGKTRIRGFVFANQAGTLKFQASADGSNWRDIESLAVTASTALPFEKPIYGKYARVVYVNGATANTVFELATYSSSL